MPDDDLPEVDVEDSEPIELELPALPASADPPEAEDPEPPRRSREPDDDILTREGVNAFLARQLRSKDLEPADLARFVELVGKVNGLFGKGDVDLRRLPNEDLAEKWRLVAPTLESLGVRIDFETGKKPVGRPRKKAKEPADRTYYGGKEFIGRTWAKKEAAAS